MKNNKIRKILSILIGGGIISFSSNLLGAEPVTNTASGDSLAIGTSNILNGSGSSVIGKNNDINANNVVVLGNSNKGSLNIIIDDITVTNSSIIGNYNEVADGRRNNIIGSNNILKGNFDTNQNIKTVAAENNIIGYNNTAAVSLQKTSLIGSNSHAVSNNSIYLGDNTTNAKDDNTGGVTGTVSSATVGGVTYSGFAGATSVGVVSVGSKDNERRIQNVAAGLISKDSTDAINGSQLYSVIANQKEESVVAGSSNVIVSQPRLNSTNGKEYVVDVNKDLNINSVKLGDNININSNGLQAGDVSISNTGINAGNQKIENIANGEKDTDATNVSQLKAVQQEIYNNNQTLNDKISDLEENTKRGIASSMAHASVKFQEQGINQVVVGAATAFYRGQGAAAVGVQGAPTENTRVHTIFSFTPGRNSNAGVSVGGSWKFNIK